MAVFAILLTAMMFTTLLTLAMSMEKNLTEMYLRQSGTSAHATARDITDEEISVIASMPGASELRTIHRRRHRGKRRAGRAAGRNPLRQ